MTTEGMSKARRPGFVKCIRAQRGPMPSQSVLVEDCGSFDRGYNAVDLSMNHVLFIFKPASTNAVAAVPNSVLTGGFFLRVTLTVLCLCCVCVLHHADRQFVPLGVLSGVVVVVQIGTTGMTVATTARYRPRYSDG